MNEKQKIQTYKKACLNTSNVQPYYSTAKAIERLFAKYLCDIQILPSKSPRKRESKRKLFDLLDILDKYTTIEHKTISTLTKTKHFVNFKTFDVPENIQDQIKNDAKIYFEKPKEL